MKHIIPPHAVLAIADVTFANVALVQGDADQYLKAFAYEVAILC